MGTTTAELALVSPADGTTPAVDMFAKPIVVANRVSGIQAFRLFGCKE